MISHYIVDRNQKLLSGAVAQRLRDFSGLGRAQTGPTAFVVFRICRNPDEEIEPSVYVFLIDLGVAISLIIT